MRGEELTTGCRFQLVSRSCPAQLRQQRSSSDSHCPNKKHVCIRGVKLGLLLYLVGSAQKSDTTQQYAKFQTHTCTSDPHMPEIKQDTAAAKVPRLYRHACSLYGQFLFCFFLSKIAWTLYELILYQEKIQKQKLTFCRMPTKGSKAPPKFSLRGPAAIPKTLPHVVRNSTTSTARTAAVQQSWK